MNFVFEVICHPIFIIKNEKFVKVVINLLVNILIGKKKFTINLID